MRYAKGNAANSLLYILGLGVAITLDRQMEFKGGTAFLVALLPVLPILWMIYLIGRYFAEEQVDYLRYRAMLASVIGRGFVLAIGSFWGFSKPFGLVVHVPGWLAVPIWALGMGLGQAWINQRDRAGDGE
ncbi:hypothetical protein GRI89_09880 [Altererythrobacter salegens]|uniref:Uncharacterized protein n=1 Tax=Croceibacterium salegens TaxID=1737568 RepID=A0A6I4SXT9_9SPHN|nr:hypothetical protein [Croceibacterium salegens]MXO59847.1 hypothetical protein [Croceibacterium salegens]